MKFINNKRQRLNVIEQKMIATFLIFHRIQRHIFRIGEIISRYKINKSRTFIIQYSIQINFGKNLRIHVGSLYAQIKIS